MGIEDKFKTAEQAIRKISLDDLSNDEKLELYAHYKQAALGDNTTKEPGMFALKDKAKWHAWMELKGMTKEQAMTRYIEISKKYLPPEVRNAL